MQGDARDLTGGVLNVERRRKVGLTDDPSIKPGTGKQTYRQNKIHVPAKNNQTVTKNVGLTNRALRLIDNRATLNLFWRFRRFRWLRYGINNVRRLFVAHEGSVQIATFSPFFS